MKKKWIIAIAVVLCLGIVCGYAILDNIFPKANPINVPSSSSVTSITVSKNEMRKAGEQQEVVNTYIDSILFQLSEAKPTRKMSVQDSPDAKIYYEISVTNNDRTHYFYVYEEGGMCYVEIPYEGIYKSESKLFTFVEECYDNGDNSVTGDDLKLESTADYPAAIMVDNVVYYLDSEIVAEVDESAIIGYTNSYTNAMPEKNGETNFNRELNMPYAKVEGGIAVLYHNEWVLCLAK